MTRVLNLIFSRRIYVPLQQSTRLAGHSKWQNIRHIKAEHDAEKSEINRRFTGKMMVAITEHGSADPVQNTKLAQLIEMAKKANVPIGTINNFLEKMKKVKTVNQSQYIELRGPGGCSIILHLLTSNFVQTKYEIQNQIKKITNTKLADPSLRYLFHHTCFIVTEKKHDLDKAMEDAIVIGAEDVVEYDENNEQSLQFKCQPVDQAKVLNQLQRLGYNISSVEETWIPKRLVTLSDDDLNQVEYLRKRMDKIEEVYKMYDNIE